MKRGYVLRLATADVVNAGARIEHIAREPLVDFAGITPLAWS
jgi:hypothetical protein